MRDAFVPFHFLQNWGMLKVGFQLISTFIFYRLSVSVIQVLYPYKGCSIFLALRLHLLQLIIAAKYFSYGILMLLL